MNVQVLYLVSAVLVISFPGLNSSVINCGFEDENLCGYVQDPTLESFTRRSGPSTYRSSGSGPATSVEGQWYMYIKGSMKTRAFARLESPEERPVFKKCLRFSYHMYGYSIWLLKVYMKTSEGLGEGIWMKTRNQGDTWYTATVEVTSFQPFRIVFEAHAGATLNCEIAIDDVKLVNCSSTACHVSTTDGGCCVLPFTYEGVVYQSCTTIKNNNVPWCSKTTNYIGQWGNCMPAGNVPDTGVSLEPWTPWKKCDQTCGSNYRARVRFWYSAELDKSFNFTYHVRYSTSDKLCPEEHRWYFDNLEDGSFGDEYGKHNAVVVSGAMNSDDRMLVVKENQDSVEISFQEGSCIFGGTSCDDGFTLSYWIYLQTQQGISSILSSSSKWEQGLRVTMSDMGTVNVTMETKDKKWVINSDITQAKWIYVALAWSECFGLTYYENGDIKEYSGIFDTKLVSDYGGLTLNDVNDILFIGKSPFAGGALFSMIELVIWRGQLPPADIKLLSHKVDGTAKFGFLKPGDDSFFEWSKGYASTPSEDTGPSFTHLRNEFDIDQEDYKPSSCNDIKYKRNGISDGYYVIYPRGSCGDALKVYCADMDGSSPEEYIDVDPDQNYAYYAGLEQPCGSSWIESGVTNFTKVRLYPDNMEVGITSFKFATIEGEKHIYGNGGACHLGADPTCLNSGHFKINLRETGLRVKPTVKWKGGGYAPNFEIMVNFIRSFDGQEISASCGGHCGWCTVDGALVFEQVSCVKKKPRSCLDVKVYHDITEDGDFIIYPISTALLPLRVFCVDMATTTPKEYINVTSSDSKNYALYSKDKAATDTCVLSSTTPLPSSYVNTQGLTRFSKVRLNVDDEMYIMNADYHFAELVFGIHHPLGWASSCFSRAACLPRGLFNIDLTGTGIGVRSTVAWRKGGWPYHLPPKLFKVQRGVFGELIDGNCGAYCGSCYPSGSLFVDLVVSHERKNWRYFGKQNTSLMETTDRGQNDRVFGLSTVCSVAVGCQSGAIPDQAFAASSSNTGSNTFHARLKHATLRGWTPLITDVDPWLSIDLLSVRLVTAIATQGDSSANYVKTYLLSYGFDGLQWLTYSNIFKLPLVFQGNGDASGVIKRDLVKPMFAQYVRFHPLTWSTSPTLRVEIYVCPRASYHHMVTSGDYFFVESSYPRNKGERSELVTRVMLPIYQCIHFWFHMTGTNMGRLDVYVEETSNDKKLTWSVFGDRGKLYWQKAAIPLAINTTFRVYIVGVVGDGCKSDMAVAGLSFTTDGNCSFSPSYASPEAAGTSCFRQCGGTTDCDPITGKCICQNKDYVGETCKNELAETLYEDAFHYWSFDNAEITDLKTGSLAQGTTERVPGPVNQAVHIKSNLHFRESIVVSCLADPSACSSGLTITLWLKYQIGRRSRFFLTSESNQLGIKVACYEGKRLVALNIQGSSHKCSRSVLVPVDIWSFVCFTWSISADGTGEIIAYYNGVAQAKRTCRSESRSFSHNSNKMKADVKSPTSYSMDELVVWNQTLSATKVMQIYDNITRNPDYSIFLTFRLESYRWHRAFGDEESEEWREAREHIAKAVSVGDKNTTQVKRIWAEFEVDECIYTGSVINGDASWHESSTLRCDDNRFGVKQELFQLELTVNSSGARVLLNNIDLGSVGGKRLSTARGGFFASTDPEDTTVLVKDYGLKPAGNSSLFTFDDCDMSRSGKFGSQYALFGQQVSTSTQHCMAIRRDTLFSGSYSVEVQLYHVSGDVYRGEETGHMGILFNYKNRKNFNYFILRPFTTSRCYEISRYENGVNQMLVTGECPTGSRPTYRTWHTLFLVVRPTFIKAYLSGVLLVHHHNNFHAHAVKVGVLVYAKDNIDIRFKDFVVVKEDHFELLSNFADSRSFSLPSFSNGVRNHAILSVVETTGSPTNVYSVSADFQFAKNDSYSVPGTSTGGFGISFNVIDEQNFDFVYYRRNRIVFADVAQMVADVSWQENEILKEKLESSSLILINKSSTKVPTHIPFNVSSVALNSTALNVSWHWDPDNDVTGLFQGFKVLYRQEDDGEESWVERIILGREFERFSPVAVTNLRKGTGYFVKLVAFSLVGDGWPSEEVFNSTHDDVPDIVDLNVTLRNIDLQTVFVQWERLPKHFRNGQLLGYIVTFQELGIAGAQLAKNLTVYGEESNMTLRELKHFTNYSATVMAFNNIGISLPTNAFVIETIEFVPAISPPNVSATVLNTSALTVSWGPIDEFLWQGLSLGYVVYINSSSKDLFKFTVPSNTLQLTITNLTAFTMYNVTLVAYTRKGLGPKSPMIRKRTEEEIPSIPPENIRVQSNQSSELVNSGSSSNIVATSYSTTIEWDPVPKEKVRGVIRGYKVTYQPVEVYYITRAYLALSSHLNPVTQNSNTSSIRLDNLLFFTNYSAHVMAYTVGDGIAGSFHFMTPEGVPAISPPNVSATVLNTSALTVSWDPIDKFLWQGLSLGYVVYINSSGKDLYNITVPSNTLQLTIANLTAFTMYNVTVVAYTRKGSGPKSPMIRKRTEEEIPSIPPVNIRVQSNQSSELVNSSSSRNIVATSYSTTIEWDPVPKEKVRGVIRGYKVTYQPVEVYYITRARRGLSSHLNPVTQNSNTSSIRLDDLLFFTNYSAHVMAYTVGDGIAGSFHFMTPEGAPSESPPNLRASHDGSKSSLSVKWDSIPLYFRNGILKGYHIYYKEESTSEPMMNITLAPDVTQVLLTDLQTFTAYDIHVCGFTIAGDGVRGIITQRTRSYDLAPYTAPWGVSTTLSSPLSVLLTWIPFPESHWHDNPRGYVITFQRVALGGAKISGDPIRRVTVGYTAGSYLWSDLTYYTEYKIEISTITYRGYGPKVILYAETCNCPSHMTTTFRLFPPYVLKTHGALRGILPDLIRQVTSSCCVPCSTFSATQIDFESDGHGNMAIKDSHPALVASLNQETTFAFPIYGHLDQTHYYARYGFIPGVQSPGMLAILKKKSPENLALAVLSSIFGIWPILIISVLFASIAGVIMWMLDSYSNEEIFPRTCIRGCLEGFWWAYISMTTVGYGDTTAKSVPARIFAVIWVLLGLCVTSILIGDLCSSLSVTVSVSESTLYGAKVAALVNSTEESVAIRRCAKLVGGPYLTLQQMQEALLDGEVDIVILDVYVAGLTKQLWNHTDLRISRVLNYPSTYGVVFSGDTYGVQHCFRKYIHDNQGRIMELVEKYTETLSSVKTESSTEYVQDLIDVQSSSFHHALLTISFSLAAAFLLGTLWNFACKRRRSTTMKKENSVHPVEITKEILCKDLEHFCSRMSQCLETMKRRHGKEIRTLRSLKERSRLRHALNCCRTKVTAAS